MGNSRSLLPPNPRGSSDSQSGSGSGSSSDSVGKSSDNSCGHLAIVQCYVCGITVNLILQSGGHLAYSNCRIDLSNGCRNKMQANISRGYINISSNIDGRRGLVLVQSR